MINHIVSPTIVVLDEWEKVFDDITLVYRIKSVSGDDDSIWYSVTCWQRGVPSHSACGRFTEQPARAQVETRFETASADIVQKVNESRIKNHSPSHASTSEKSLILQEIPTTSPASILSHSPPIKNQEIYHRHTPQLQLILKESDWLKKQSIQILSKSAALSARLALLNERSRRLCKI